jgi:hypothetical protein
MFAKDLLHYDMTTFIPCLLLVKAPHYHHLNLKTISLKRSNWTDFQNRGAAMMKCYNDLYPTWESMHSIYNSSTLPNSVNSVLRKVTSYPKTCPLYSMEPHRRLWNLESSKKQQL